MGKKSKNSASPEETHKNYSVGALSSIISTNSSSLPFESLFSTDKKQKDASPPPSLPLSEVPPPKKEDEDEQNQTKGGPPPAEDAPSLRRKVLQEDAKKFQLDPEKEKRTVFIGNLGVLTKKKDLMKQFKDCGSIESIRFRGAARPDDKTLKKVAIIKKMNHESRDTFLAYIRFKTMDSAAEAIKMNGVEFNGKTLRVDSALKSQVDQKKAIFVGNLDFSLSEEDLLSHFRVCGEVSNVRLIRDTSTGMGKGFGYVNFSTTDGAQNALELQGSKLNGRSIRVSRSSNRPKAVMIKKKSLPSVNKGQEKQHSASSHKKVNKNYDKHSFQGLNVGGSEEKSKKKNNRTKAERKKSILAKKLLNT